jgi:hypothetical protein
MRAENVRPAAMLASFSHVKVGEDLLGVGQNADDFANWKRPFSHRRWHDSNLVLLRKLRIFRHINDLDSVTAREVLFADPL